MAIYYVILEQTQFPGGHYGYTIIKSIPTTLQDLDRLFIEEFEPLHRNNYRLSFMIFGREPDNPFKEVDR